MARKRDDLGRILMDCRALGLPEPELEYRFCDRRWRFDAAWPAYMVALEYDGGTWSGGRHVTGRGHESDARKRNAAILLGWRVFTTTPNMAAEMADILSEALGHD